ncbi:GNAT family N-acetyltransferase [Paenibacillus sp. CF384]|uniref:GNAT family N-acetyltransferase n=1 Tax=Paenibacillus sp. CF384 TaxID=1884382 RepID=UPI00089B120D|nr:GNAT family N-acetyltransferase [Paenibacillus sp. CF384]SDW22187.1 Acetyltransferase (GNAT) family protein [Paenibacillus sp. CF384]
MRNDCKLILVEGLCGTGKSTLAERLHHYLVQQGRSCCFYDEGAEGHPVSLNWHAFFRAEEYKDLLERYPNTADEIRSRAIKDDSIYLLPYRGVKEFSEQDALYAELKSRELCWTDSPIATQPEFTYLIQRHWARFVEHASHTDTVYVLEAVVFQHQIHDLLRHYQASDNQIKQHIHGIAECIAAMNPVLIYLTQPSVRDQQVWISSIRSKPNFATEQNIRFMENRKRIELSLLDTLPFPAHTIENVNLDWDDVFCKMISAMSEAEVVQLTEGLLNEASKLLVNYMYPNGDYGKSQEEECKESLERLLDFHHADFYMAKVEGDYVGFIATNWGFSTTKGQPILRIQDLYVSDDYRRHGIAQLLVRRVLKIAKLKNANRIQLDTSSVNTPARRLYESLGFEWFSEKEIYMLFLNGHD